MKFELKNTTGEDIEIKNALNSPSVKLISDVVKTKSKMTFLSNDFSTYSGVVKAGKSVETILIFEVSESVAEKISNPSLQIKIGNSTKTIKL